MYAAKNNHILCVENLFKTAEINAKWRDYVIIILMKRKKHF